jgi:hypothetical protein
MTQKFQFLRTLRQKTAVFLDPLRFKQYRVRSSPTASLREKIHWEALPRTHFGYGLHSAAVQAKALGIDRITAIEFGCAGGNGLLELENLSTALLRELGVAVDVYGFDIGEGLPIPVDYRDLPYAWKSGQFEMDVDKLRARLSTARLIIGDVKDTVPEFRSRGDIAPIGFISFDLDYHSSTKHALTILEHGDNHILPRVYCYFDDIIGPDHEVHCKYVGELLAIEEFNERNDMLKLAPINGLRHKRIFPAAWNETMFVAHSFSHPLYCNYIGDYYDFDYELGLSS